MYEGIRFTAGGIPSRIFRLPLIIAVLRASLVACGLLSFVSTPPTALGDVVFPADPAVLNAKRDFGAVGDGVANDTTALQSSLDASCGTGGSTRILFIPNGVYLVTNTLVVKSGVGPWIYGESRDGVVIRMTDNITNLVTNCTAVIRTHPSDTQESSADFFMRNIRHLTIDVGQNPAVDGIRWYGNNTSPLKDIHVIGNGKVGINAGFLGQNGPNLIQDILVEGFETGIASSWSWGGTISRATIRNCRKYGVYVTANSVGIEDLVVENTPCAVFNDYPNDWTWWGGVIALINGQFSGGSATQPAITNRSVLYVRNVVASGFKQALASTTPGGSLAGSTIAEYSSHGPTKLYNESPDQSFKLPIKPEPEVPWEMNLAKWVCANTNGATYGDNTDDTAALQNTINAAAAAGATTVYLRGIGGGDPNWYTLNGEVRVHGSVRHIIGLGFGRIIAGPNGRFVVDDNSAPVVKFQHLQAFGGNPPAVENRSSTNTLVVESCDLKVVGLGQGDIFVTDCSCRAELRSAGQSLWARQLNPEGDDDYGLVRNQGGKLWALGVKNEGRGVRFLNDNGGQTEVFGMLLYGPGIAADDARPIFDTDNSPFCAMGVREISFGDTYPVKVREVRNGAIRTTVGGGWIGWPLYSGWTPAQTNGPVAVALPRLTPSGVNFLNSISISAQTTTPAAELRYTTNGSEPTIASPLWPSPLDVTNTTTVRVKGFLGTLQPSATCTGLFTALTLRNAEPVWVPTNGLSYSYYELSGTPSSLPNFASLTPRTTGTVTAIDLTPRLRTNNIALRFAGFLTVPTDGIYTFYLSSDDGSRLWIGTTLVVDNDGSHAAQEKSTQIALKAGQHPFVVTYFNGSGDSSLTVNYAGPGISKQAIPSSAFVVKESAPVRKGRQAGLDYQYFEGNWSVLPDFNALTPLKAGVIPGVSLAPRSRNDYFGFRFFGWVDLPSSGIWRFYTSSDDGSKLWLDGVELVNNDGSHGSQERSGSMACVAGYHSLLVHFFEGNGSEILAVSYEGPGVTKRALPASALWRTPPGVVDFGIENSRLSLTYVRPLIGPGSQYQCSVETSADIANWASEPANLSRLLNLTPYELVTFARLPYIQPGGSGYLRLRITTQ